jgi:hypothetical protein
LNQAVKALGLEGEHFVLNDLRRTGLGQLRDLQLSANGNGALAASENAGNRAGDPSALTAQDMQSWADFVDTQLSQEGRALVYSPRA